MQNLGISEKRRERMKKHAKTAVLLAFWAVRRDGWIKFCKYRANEFLRFLVRFLKM